MKTSRKKTNKIHTIDERIESLLTDHKILLFRYDAHLRRQIYPKLERLQRQLLSRISALGTDTLSHRALNKLLTELKTVITQHYVEISAFSQQELKALLPIEVNATTHLYNTAVRSICLILSLN